MRHKAFLDLASPVLMNKMVTMSDWGGDGGLFVLLLLLLSPPLLPLLPKPNVPTWPVPVSCLNVYAPGNQGNHREFVCLFLHIIIHSY